MFTAFLIFLIIVGILSLYIKNILDQTPRYSRAARQQGIV